MPDENNLTALDPILDQTMDDFHAPSKKVEIEMEEFNPELQKVVARLKIESKLKHLRDMSNSNSTRFQKTFLP